MKHHRLVVLASALATVISASSATAGGKGACCGPMVSGPVQATPTDETPAPSAVTPSEAEWDLASSLDVASAPRALAPNMIGDSLGIPTLAGHFFIGDYLFWHRHFTKVADNNSALPLDRFGVSYNLYYNAPVLYENSVFANRLQGGNIEEFKFVGEKTFANGLLSAQVTVPFANTVAFDQVVPDPSWGYQATELGNLAFTLKALLYQDWRFAIASGLLIETPTADDFTRFDPSIYRTTIVHENEAWYLTPFAALLVTPNDRLFSQNFISHRVATSGNAYTVNGRVYSYIRQANMLMIDSSVGYWIYRDPRSRILTGLAPTLELHYTTTTEDSDKPEINRVDYLSLTIGGTAEINRNATLATGLVLPLRANADGNVGQTDRNFDWELAVQLNIRYGNSRR